MLNNDTRNDNDGDNNDNTSSYDIISCPATRAVMAFAAKGATPIPTPIMPTQGKTALPLYISCVRVYSVIVCYSITYYIA